jgi:hypothetical protein
MPQKFQPPDEQTLDELEGVVWGPPGFESALVTNVHRLRRVPLKEYRLEDLRLMIGQEVGLPYLVPRALDHLEAHPLAEGDLYPGDLLAAVARLPDEFWSARPQLLPRALRAIDAALGRPGDVDTIEELGDELRMARHRLAALGAASNAPIASSGSTGGMRKPA